MKILLVEDERMTRIALTGILRNEGHEVTPCPDGQGALAALKQDRFEVVLTDLNLPGPDGIEILAAARQLNAHCKVIIMTAYASTETAIAALRQGAYDYLSKPFQPDEVLTRIGHIQQLNSIQEENRTLKKRIADIDEHPLVGDSPVMKKLYESIAAVADGQFNVLIEGASGTGKELVARSIHRQSQRCDGPLVAINCAAIPENLLESELFGYRKGAFTGADRNHDGYILRAEGGTFFIDDIDDMPLSVQVKMLRVIQEREIEPVGGGSPVPVDFRLISATKVDLQAKVAAGQFREDLFYRLNVIPLHLPPLRDRKEDIPALVAHFSHRTAPEKALELSPEQYRSLMAHHWPGNIRELQNVVQRLLALPQVPVLELFDRPLSVSDSSPGQGSGLDRATFQGYRQHMQTCEEELIKWALKESEGNITTAARLLDLPRSTLRSKLEKR